MDILESQNKLQSEYGSTQKLADALQVQYESREK